MKRHGTAGWAFLLASSLFTLCGQALAEEPAPPAAVPVPPTVAHAVTPPPYSLAVAPTPGPTAPPVVTPPPAAPPAPVVAPRPQLVASPGHAVVHLAVSYRDAWLETRKYVDGGEFVRTCQAPCDAMMNVDGLEARVVAPGMTTSNTFRFDGGAGTAGVRVDGGSATVRTAGVITLAVGIPVALAGMALFAQGKVHDKPGLTAAGIAGLSLGGVSICVSLPLLLIGSTHVKSAKGTRIASLFALSPSN